MDAIVLAGGYASRLWPITRDRPKMFLPVGEGTIVDRIFEQLEADDRIDRVFVSTNQEFAGHFRAYIDESPYEKPVLSVEATTSEEEKFGVVGALAQLVQREELEDDLLVVAGDNYVSFDLSDFVDAFEARDAPTIVAYDVGSLERATAYGIVTLDGDRVIDFEEKPDDPTSTLVSIACYAFPADAVPLFSEYLQAGNNPDEPGWFVKWLQGRRTTYAETFDEAWFDIGTPASYLDTVEHVLEGGRLVEEGATVTDSELGETVHVMEGAEVVDSELSRCVVFPGARIEDASLASSIVDEDAKISGVALSESLLGQSTVVSSER